MFFKLFIILCVLNKLTALPQILKRNNEAAIWIYNEYLDRCLYVSEYLDEPLTYDICDNTNNSKWYLDEDDNGIYFKSAFHKDMCMSAINNHIVLSKCDESAVMKYIEASKFIKSSNMCLSVIDDETDPDYLTLTNCNRNNKKLIFEISNRRPTKKVTSTATTTTTTTATTTTTTTTTQSVPTINYSDKPKYLYNAFVNKCLFAQAKINQPPLIKDCKNNNRFKWYLSKGYFLSYANTDRCLSISDDVNNTLKVGTCSSNANTFVYTDEGSIFTSNNEDKCLSTNEDDENDDKIYLNTCYDFDNQIWSLWDTNPYDIINAETQTVWIYNKKLKKCLYSNYNGKLIISDCDDSKNSLWQIPISGDGFYKSLLSNLCLQSNDINKGSIFMDDCNHKSVIYDINDTYNSESIISYLDEDKCLGLFQSNRANENRVNLNICDDSMDDQHWEIIVKCGKDIGNCPYG